MLETKYSSLLTVLLVLIIIAIIGLGGYLGYSYYKNYTIKNDADENVSTFIEETENKNKDNQDGSDLGISDDINSTEASLASKENKYKGFNYIGAIQIPKIDVKYFVLEGPPDAQRLNTSVVALYPQKATLNSVGNVVITGHNYRNGLFFSDIKKLQNGDKITITDLDGNKVTYEVYNVFQAQQDDTDFYNRDTDGKREITLSSCTDASDENRVIVEAREAE